MRLGRINHLSAVFPAGSSGKPQILLKITSQKHTWNPDKKPEESNGGLISSHFVRSQVDNTIST